MSSVKSPFDWSQLESLDSRERIERLKKRAEELGGGEAVSYEDPDTPLHILEQFWTQVVKTEEKEHFPQMQPRLPPVEIPEIGALGDEEVSVILWQVVTELGKRRIYLEQTNHLSDRELLEHLLQSEIREASTEVIDANGACHHDVLGSYSDEDLQLYLKYYADNLTVEEWRADWPALEVPPHEDPPYDRDSRLPKPDYRR